MTRPAKTHKILVVDDEPKITDTLALIFTTQGYEVRTAYKAEDAIEVIASWQPDLAILDVILPHLNGIELAIVLRMNHPRCRILLFSAQPDAAELLELAARRGHCFEILAKPVHPAVILERAADLLAVAPEEMLEEPNLPVSRPPD